MASAKNMIKVGLAQLNISWENKEHNKRRVEKLVERASKFGVDLVIFPEMTLTGFSMNVSKTGEDESDSDTVHFFSKLSKKYKIAVVFGAVFLENKKGKNMFIWVNKNGRQVALYQKIHPFSLAKENDFFNGGKTAGQVFNAGFKFGFLICYDLRFMGLAQALLINRPDILICIANWPGKRIKHWQTLLRARALDLQCYVLGVNRKGTGGGLSYPGKSAAVFADGSYEDIVWKGDLGIVNIDKKKLESYRISFPFLTDSKPKIFNPASGLARQV